MSRKTRYSRALVQVAATLFFLELLLRLFDPAGVRYYNEGTHFMAAMQHQRGEFYLLPVTGRYEFSEFSATITAQGRAVPDTRNCTIAAIGDSVTFGYGVNDAETWVNLLAREFPQVHFINAGVPGYNSRHILRSMTTLDTNGYLYLVSKNDALRITFRASTTYVDYVPYLTLYGVHLRGLWAGEGEGDVGAFLVDLEAIMNQGEVQLFAFEPAALHRLRSAGYAVVYTPIGNRDRVSGVDPHPNAEGHRKIASAMLPQVGELIERVCKKEQEK